MKTYKITIEIIKQTPDSYYRTVTQIVMIKALSKENARDLISQVIDRSAMIISIE